MADPTKSTALAPIEPTTFAEATALAEYVAKAALLPLALRGKPADVLVSILAGRELGLSPMQSLRGMHVIEGKPTLSADTMVALCVRRADVCRYFQITQTTDKLATYETHRVGAPRPVSMSFTIAQAQRAGLVNKTNWKNYPEAMLRARAAASLARAVYPDLLAGVYDPDEVPPPEPGPPSIAVEFTKVEAVPAAEPEAQADEPRAAATITLADAALAGIDAAKTKAELDALVDEVKAVTPYGARAVVRARWVAKATELTQAPPAQPVPQPSVAA